MTPETVLQILDYAAVAVFAVTGALAASRSQLDIVGFIFIACLTATGGGTTRDVIPDRTVFRKAATARFCGSTPSRWPSPCPQAWPPRPAWRRPGPSSWSWA